MKLNEKVLKNENKFLYEGTFKIPTNEKICDKYKISIPNKYPWYINDIK